MDLLNKRQTDPVAEPAIASLSHKGQAAVQRMKAISAKGSIKRSHHGKASKAKFSLANVLSNLQKKFAPSDDVMALIEHEVQERTQELYRKANFDALTHLPNRRHFHEMLDDLVQRQSKYDDPFTLLFLDLDGFKKVNDHFGHHIGDELLRHVSARLVSSVRDGDIVSRLGGDEFVVLLASTDDREVIETICKRIIHETARPYWFDDAEVKVSSSIGIACFPRDADSASDLIEKADEALYVSKSKGKKTYRFFNEVVNEVPSSGYLVQNRFEEAIQQGQLHTFVEPQFDLKHARMVGVSLSMEWEDSQLPNNLFESWSDLLKKSGWEHAVSLWLIDTGFYYLNKWQKQAPELVISIPILESFWRSTDFMQNLEARVERYQVPRSQIQLEFSLAEFVSYDRFFQQVLNRLSEKGFQITLTGVGAVPIDLALMAGLNIQEFRLDAEWLKKHIETESGRQWIKAVIQMASSLDACVIAPGIQTQHMADVLTDMGCNLAQGNFWSEPVRAEGFTPVI